MKKTVSVVLALAVILMMSLSAFAYDGISTAKPTDPNDYSGWVAYYSELLTHVDEDKNGVENAIKEDIDAGAISSDIFENVITDAKLNAQYSVSDRTALNSVVENTISYNANGGSGGSGGSLLPDLSLPDISLPDVSLPDVSLPDVSIPSEFPSDITLPSVGGDDSGNGSFLDTILGALGGIVDGIFGGGDSTGGDTNGGDDSNTSGGDDEDLWGSEGDDPFNDNSLGDTSVIAVAAVAVVAGAALVLTRKKSKDEDAE